jgi:alcohol dehydrogenase, propanol-preferring
VRRVSGPFGSQSTKVLGLHVISADAGAEALSLGKECGADILVCARSGKEKVVEEVMKVLGG